MNKDFQLTVRDQEATQDLLNKAMTVLQGSYGENGVALDQQEPAGPPPPAGFKSYEKSSGSSNVISMIKQIVEDAKHMQAEAVKAEQDSQNAYESFVTATNKSIQDKLAQARSKTRTKG